MKTLRPAHLPQISLLISAYLPFATKPTPTISTVKPSDVLGFRQTTFASKDEHCRADCGGVLAAVPVRLGKRGCTDYIGCNRRASSRVPNELGTVRRLLSDACKWESVDGALDLDRLASPTLIITYQHLPTRIRTGPRCRITRNRLESPWRGLALPPGLWTSAPECSPTVSVHAETRVTLCSDGRVHHTPPSDNAMTATAVASFGYFQDNHPLQNNSGTLTPLTL